METKWLNWNHELLLDICSPMHVLVLNNLFLSVVLSFSMSAFLQIDVSDVIGMVQKLIISDYEQQKVSLSLPLSMNLIFACFSHNPYILAPSYS